VHDRRPTPSSDLALLVAPFDRWFFYPAARTIFSGMRNLPVTPNQISVLHLILGVSSFWWLAKPSGPSVGIATAVYLMRNVLDCLDGVVARARNLTSPMGRALDEWSDALSATALIAGTAIAAWRTDPGPWIPAIAAMAIAASAILAPQNELCRRRIGRAIETGEDCVWPDYQETRRARHSSIVSWLGYVADATKLRVSGARLDPVRLSAEARFVHAGRGRADLRRLLRILSIAAGDNAIMLLLAFVAAGQFVWGLTAITAYAAALAACTYISMTTYLSQAAVKA
jgi:phosphatidylglycerophosphate synthase